jgi:maleate isomerase
MDNNVRRIGTIAPPGNVAVEREFPLYLPSGVVTNHNRLSRPNSEQTRESILAMNLSLEQTARDLAQCYPEVIAYACTGGSFLEGPGEEAKTADLITRVTGIKAVTTSIAVIEALAVFNARKVVLIAPYPDDIMENEVQYLRHYGITTVLFDTFRCMTSEANRALSSEQVATRTLTHRTSIAEADAIFISCTNILVMDQIARLETEMGVPVITSNQVTLWAALRTMGIQTSGLHAGRLFEAS